MKKKVYDLDERLIRFGVQMIEIAESYDKKREAGRHLSAQLVRSGTSPGIHYGEAQAAESRRDFIHKMKVILKELRECAGNLKMAGLAGIHTSQSQNAIAITECGELIAIFVKSIQTAERKSRRVMKRSEPQNRETEE